MPNVKKGDMAKVVGQHDARGSVCEVLAVLNDVELRQMQRVCRDWSFKLVWCVKLFSGGKGYAVDGSDRTFHPGDEVYIADEFLRPIPPQRDPAYDETAYGYRDVTGALVNIEPVAYRGVKPLTHDATL